jgi:hypothetical protein
MLGHQLFCDRHHKLSCPKWFIVTVGSRTVNASYLICFNESKPPVPAARLRVRQQKGARQFSWGSSQIAILPRNWSDNRHGPDLAKRPFLILFDGDVQDFAAPEIAPQSWSGG